MSVAFGKQENIMLPIMTPQQKRTFNNESGNLLSTHHINSLGNDVGLGPVRTKSVSVAKPTIARDIFTENDKH